MPIEPIEDATKLFVGMSYDAAFDEATRRGYEVVLIRTTCGYGKAKKAARCRVVDRATAASSHHRNWSIG